MLPSDNGDGRERDTPLDVVRITVGPLEENTYIVRATPESRAAVMIDPGDEAERLIESVQALDVTVEGILITHCHFDHVGAVAAAAAHTGAAVYCPGAERELLVRIMESVPPGFGPFDGFEADRTVQGGERLAIADLDIRVLFTPGHSAGHMTYAIAPAGGDDSNAATCALFVGDVILKGGVGRTDLAGGSWPLLKDSIRALLGAFAPDSVIHPGHGEPTTLREERAGSSLLARLAKDAETPPG